MVEPPAPPDTGLGLAVGIGLHQGADIASMAAVQMESDTALVVDAADQGAAVG